MKSRLAAVLCGAALAWSFSVQAVPLLITNNGDGTDDPFNDIVGGGNSDVTLFEWLKGEILSWNNFVNDPELPEPTPFLTIYNDLNGDGPVINVQAGDYLVLHYGTGPNGTPSKGGGLVAYYFDADGTFDIPDNGSGPNGTGGVSFGRLWDHAPGTSVPESSITLLLLGSALSFLALIRRK